MTEKPKFSLLGGFRNATPAGHNAPTAEKPAVKARNLLSGSVLGGDKTGTTESKPAQVAADEAPAGSNQGDGSSATGGAVPAVPAKTGYALLDSVHKAVAKKKAEEQDYAHLFEEAPIDFQDLLNRFDSLLERDNGVSMMNIDLCRSYVKRIMVDLKEHPEYDGLIIDRDVHNVIKFIRSIKESAAQTVIEKKAKAEKTAATKAAKKNRFGDLSNVNLDFTKNIDFEELKDMDL